MDNIPITDTHFHIWDTSQLTLEWVQAFSSLKQKYTLKDYQAATKNQFFTKSCYAEVDVIKSDLTKESDYIMEVCHSDQNRVEGAILGCDLASENFEAYIKKYIGTGYVKSVRHNFFACDPDVINSDIFVKNTKLLGRLNILCDLTMHPNFMHHGLKLVQKCLETTFVVDHCGFFPLTGEEKLMTEWYQGISNYAVEENIICKVSEFCFMAPDYRWKIADVMPVIQHCVDSFGEDRIVYGSNWPVCEITGTVDLWFDALKALFKDKPESFWHKLLHRNAEIYYKI